MPFLILSVVKILCALSKQHHKHEDFYYINGDKDASLLFKLVSALL